MSISNPFEKVKFVEKDYIANYLSRIEYERLLKSALATGNTDLHDFIVLLTMTGCRPIEILTLEWSNVHLDKKQFIVRNHYSKSKKTMYKYLNQTALSLLLERQANAMGVMFLLILLLMIDIKVLAKVFSFAKSALE